MPPFRQASLPTTASSPSEYQDTLRVVHKTRPSAYIRHLHLYCVCSVTFSCSELWGEDRFHRGGLQAILWGEQVGQIRDSHPFLTIGRDC